MNIQIVRQFDENKWRSFVNNHPAGTIFHSPEMYKVFQQTEEHFPEFWAAISSNENILALFLPVKIATKKFGVSLILRSISYGSILFENSSDGREGLEKLFRQYLKENKGIIYTELRNLFDLQEVRPFLEEIGFKYEGHLNYLINLDHTEEEIFNAIKKRTRKQIRKGISSDQIQIIELVHSEQITDFYDLIQQTYANAHVPLADISLFRSAFDILYPKGMIRFTHAQINGNPAATSVELLFKDVLYGWYGGTDRQFSSFYPTEILLWNILMTGAKQGYKIYDFGGAGKPDEEYGVRDFKAKFGGELVNFGRFTYLHHPKLYHIITSVYKYIRKFI